MDSSLIENVGKSSDILLLIISAICGGFFGALFVSYLPGIWSAPRLRIAAIDIHGGYFRLLVENKGRCAAINAVGRVTIRKIGKEDVMGTRDEIYKIRRESYGNEHWRETNDAYIRSEEWETGIEWEPLHWATMPSDMKLTINPSFKERLHFVFSDGPYVKIASENRHTSRVRLRLDKNKKYFGKAIVSAENSKPSNTFQFMITLGENNRASVLPYKGDLPEF